jgi:hypothetical protein
MTSSGVLRRSSRSTYRFGYASGIELRAALLEVILISLSERRE